MKNKVFKTILAVVICIILSSLIEILGFNFNILTLNNDQISSQVDYEITTEKDKHIINISTEGKYINKLLINFSAQAQTPYKLTYTVPDPYGNEISKSYEDVFDNLMPTSITNLRDNVSHITITYDKDADLIINSISIDNDFHFNIRRFIFVFLILSLICLFYFFYKSGFESEKLHIYFALVGTILGLMIIVAQPSAVFYSLDDQIHFQRTQGIFSNGTYNEGEYQMTRGDPSESIGGRAIGSAEEQDIQNSFNNSNSQIEYYNSRTPLKYDKIAYLPMAIGYQLVKLANLPFTVAFTIGKIFNLLFYIFLIAYAIRCTKVGKRFLTVISLIPTNIFLATQYSYDPAVFAGIVVFSVKVLNLLIDKNAKLDFRTALIIIASISLACFTKAIYAPLLLLTLLIPKQKFDTKKQSIYVKTGFIGITLLLMSTFILPTLSGSMESDVRGGDTSVSEQLSLIASHPLGYTQILGNNAIDQFMDKIVGVNTLTHFGYMPTPILSHNSNLYLILLIFIFFFLFTDNINNTLNKKQRISIILTCLVTTIMIWTALYLSYTPVGFTAINGVQNRYFLPMLFLILIAIQPKGIQNKISTSVYNALTIAIPTIIMIISIYVCILYTYSF